MKCPYCKAEGLACIPGTLTGGIAQWLTGLLFLDTPKEEDLPYAFDCKACGGPLTATLTVRFSLSKLKAE